VSYKIAITRYCEPDGWVAIDVYDERRQVPTRPLGRGQYFELWSTKGKTVKVFRRAKTLDALFSTDRRGSRIEPGRYALPRSSGTNRFLRRAMRADRARQGAR
jgi:hypothetical protein